MDNAEQAVDDDQDKPTVLMLSQVGFNTGPYILGPSMTLFSMPAGSQVLMCLD